MLVSFDSLKTFYNIILQKLQNHRGNWEQNDPNADDYISNRPFYSEGNVVTIIDNLTKVDYDNGKRPKCNFVVGEKYNVVWNGDLYEDIECIPDGDANVIVFEGCPFVIVDIGGNDLFVGYNGDGDWTFSVYHGKEVVHKIDPKYLPTSVASEGVVTEEDLAPVAFSGSFEDLVDIPDFAPVAFTNDYNDLINTPTNTLIYDEQLLSDDEKLQARTNIGAGTSDFDGVYDSLNNKPCYVEDVAGERKIIYYGTSVKSSVDKNNSLGNIRILQQEWQDLTWGDIVSADYLSLLAQREVDGYIYANLNLPSRTVSEPIKWTNDSFLSDSFIPDYGIVFGNIGLITGKFEDDTGENAAVFYTSNAITILKEFIVVRGISASTGHYDYWYGTPHNYVYHELDEKLIPDTISRTSDVEALQTLVGETPVSEQIAAAVSQSAKIQIITWEADD